MNYIENVVHRKHAVMYLSVNLRCIHHEACSKVCKFAKINININIKVNKTSHSLLEVQQEHVGTDPFFLVCKAVWCEMIHANRKVQTIVGNPREGIPASILWAYPFKNKTQPLRLQRLGFRNIKMTAVFLITPKNNRRRHSAHRQRSSEGINNDARTMIDSSLMSEGGCVLKRCSCQSQSWEGRPTV